jgi:hypothetical protein
MWYRYSKLLYASKEHIIRKVNEYFNKPEVNQNQLSDIIQKLNELDKNNSLPVLEVSNNGVKLGDQIYSDWLPFTEAVDGLHSVYEFKKSKKQKPQESAPEVLTGKITVFPIHDVSEAIRYGLGTSWCISQPGNTMYQSYRDLNNSTFYYISDGTRSSNDPLSRVMLDVNQNKISLTDLSNTTGRISEFGTDENSYLNYLKSQGVNVNQFQNRPYTEEEKQENQLLGEKNTDLNFEDFPIQNRLDYISKYIGRGHLLSDSQLDYILSLDNQTKNYLVNQYLSTGKSIPPNQHDKVFLNNQLKRTYDVTRARSVEEVKKHFQGHKQKIQDYALRNEDYELISEIGVENLSSVNASEKMIRYLLQKQMSPDRVNWLWISINQTLSEDFIREFRDRVNWLWISRKQNLSEDFIREFQDRVDWDSISRNQTLSEDFIREFQNRVKWGTISYNQNLSEDFIREFRDRVKWLLISRKQNLSEDFIREFQNRVNWFDISSNPNINRQVKINLGKSFLP